MVNCSISLLENTQNVVTKLSNSINRKLQAEKEKQAYKVFDNNTYIQEYVKTFYNSFEEKFFDNSNELLYFNSFDFTKIPQNLKEELKEYMSYYNCMYYYKDDYIEGFTICSFDNIYITYEDGIYADFLKRSDNWLKYNNDLDLFCKLELIQHENGIYPDICYTDYYGQYRSDYEVPEDYKFLKTCMHSKEDRLVHFLDKIIELCNPDYIDRIDDNFILEDNTPDFIKKIDNNMRVYVYNVELDADFNLHVTYEISTKLKEKDLKKLNITDYSFDKYGNTLINIDVNIKEYLQTELKKGYNFEELRK